MHVSAQPGRAHKHGQLAAYDVLYPCGRGQGWKGRPGSGPPPVRPPGGDPRLEYKIRLGPAPHPYLFPFGRGGGRVVTRGWSSNGWVEGTHRVRCGEMGLAFHGHIHTSGRSSQSGCCISALAKESRWAGLNANILGFNSAESSTIEQEDMERRKSHRQHAPAAHHLASLSYPATVTCPTTTPFLTGELDLPAGGGKQRDLAGTACPTGSHVGTLMAWTWEWVERLMGGDLRCLRPHARIIYLACRAHACVWDKSKPPVKKFSIDRVFLVHCHPPCSMPFWRLRLRWGSDRGARTWGQRWKGGTAVGALKQRGGPELHDVLLSPPG